MSILRDALPGAKVLDLFAGSGALGIEALSRGAASAVFVERHPDALAALESNIQALHVGNQASIVRSDALGFVERLAAGAFDVVLADPPYSSDAAATLIECFRRVPFARILSVEHAATTDLAGDATREYGSTAITFCYAP